MILFYIRYTDCNVMDDTDIVKTEFFESISDLMSRRNELLIRAVKEADGFFFDGLAHQIEYDRTSELMIELNNINH